LAEADSDKLTLPHPAHQLLTLPDTWIENLWNRGEALSVSL